MTYIKQGYVFKPKITYLLQKTKYYTMKKEKVVIILNLNAPKSSVILTSLNTLL